MADDTGSRELGSRYFQMTLQSLVQYCSGNLTRRTLILVLIPLIFASYFGTLAFAISFAPGVFDWRSRAISKLLYPENDPQFHWIASIGVSIAGLLMIPFAGYISRRLRPCSSIASNAGAFVFGAGAVSLSLAALIVSHPSRGSSSFSSLHETLARFSAIAFGAGMLFFYWCAVRARSIPAADKESRFRILVAWGLLTLPAILVVAMRVLAHARLQWSNPVYRALENRALWQLGFWEWLGSAAVFLFLLSSALLLPECACE
ncbi:MAG TPA: hypothetical protein VIX12_00785 [Candidatus Binataceae bacterium]